jgi:hypothetical protein
LAPRCAADCFRCEAAARTAFLVAYVKRAVLGPLGRGAHSILSTSTPAVLRERRLGGRKQAFHGCACRPGVRPERTFRFASCQCQLFLYSETIDRQSGSAAQPSGSPSPKGSTPNARTNSASSTT